MPHDSTTTDREPRHTIAVHDRRTATAHLSTAKPATEHGLLASLRAGGTDGNERLTTATGIVLLILLAVIGVTLLRMHSLLWVHLFVDMLLLGPIALKLASTGYRFVRYYTGEPRYRRKGPPPAPLRMIAPIVVLATIAVFLSGVLLLLIGPSSRGALMPLHKISFIVWVVFTSLHVLGHLPEVGAALGFGAETTSKIDVLTAVGASQDDELSTWHSPGAIGAARAGRAGRALSLAGALTSGTLLAVAVIPQFGPWLNATNVFHHH
jgi:hypothetical protein